MCLAVPGRVESMASDDAGMQMGRVSFGGIVKDVCLSYVPDVTVGDYVLVHIGFALQKIDQEEAAQVFRYLEEMDELGDLQDTSAAGAPDP
jgi:hydrogenase expression/formation protein HypC